MCNLSKNTYKDTKLSLEVNTKLKMKLIGPCGICKKD